MTVTGSNGASIEQDNGDDAEEEEEGLGHRHKRARIDSSTSNVAHDHDDRIVGGSNVQSSSSSSSSSDLNGSVDRELLSCTAKSVGEPNIHESPRDCRLLSTLFGPSRLFTLWSYLRLVAAAHQQPFERFVTRHEQQIAEDLRRQACEARQQQPSEPQQQQQQQQMLYVSRPQDASVEYVLALSDLIVVTPPSITRPWPTYAVSFEQTCTMQEIIDRIIAQTVRTQSNNINSMAAAAAAVNVNSSNNNASGTTGSFNALAPSRSSCLSLAHRPAACWSSAVSGNVLGFGFRAQRDHSQRNKPTKPLSLRDQKEEGDRTDAAAASSTASTALQARAAILLQGYDGIECFYPNTPLNELRRRPWVTLLSRAGDSIISYLLSHCVVLLRLPNRCFMQLSGAPVVQICKNQQPLFMPLWSRQSPSEQHPSRSITMEAVAPDQLAIDSSSTTEPTQSSVQSQSASISSRNPRKRTRDSSTDDLTPAPKRPRLDETPESESQQFLPLVYSPSPPSSPAERADDSGNQSKRRRPTQWQRRAAKRNKGKGSKMTDTRTTPRPKDTTTSSERHFSKSPLSPSHVLLPETVSRTARVLQGSSVPRIFLGCQMPVNTSSSSSSSSSLSLPASLPNSATSGTHVVWITKSNTILPRTRIFYCNPHSRAPVNCLPVNRTHALSLLPSTGKDSPSVLI